jgi:hypothetical protein
MVQSKIEIYTFPEELSTLYLQACYESPQTDTVGHVLITIWTSTIISEIDKRKLQFLGRLCRLESDSRTKQIFLNQLFSYTDFPKRKHYGFIPDVINLLKKYNLKTHLNSCL